MSTLSPDPVMLGRTLSLVAVALLVTACKDSTSSGPPVVSTLTCTTPSGPINECTLPMPFHGSFSVTLQSTSCTARNNRVRLTQPATIAQTITNDGCYEQTPRTWGPYGPYAEGDAIALEVESARLQNLPELKVTEQSTGWLIEFEDGADVDFDDIVLVVTPTPTGG